MMIAERTIIILLATLGAAVAICLTLLKMPIGRKRVPLLELLVKNERLVLALLAVAILLTPVFFSLLHNRQLLSNSVAAAFIIQLGLAVVIAWFLYEMWRLAVTANNVLKKTTLIRRQEEAADSLAAVPEQIMPQPTMPIPLTETQASEIFKLVEDANLLDDLSHRDYAETVETMLIALSGNVVPLGRFVRVVDKLISVPSSDPNVPRKTVEALHLYDILGRLNNDWPIPSDQLSVQDRKLIRNLEQGLVKHKLADIVVEKYETDVYGWNLYDDQGVFQISLDPLMMPRSIRRNGMNILASFYGVYLDTLEGHSGVHLVTLEEYSPRQGAPPIIQDGKIWLTTEYQGA